MLHVTRPTVIIGNWKMHKTIVEARAFVASLALTGHSDWMQVGLAVPFTMLTIATEAARGSSVSIGAQNIAEEAIGAYTGEVSGEMIKDAGASFTLIGHSERRRLFNEDNLVVNKKVFQALNANLRAFVCIGETLEQRHAKQTNQVLKEQLLGSLNDVSEEQMEQVVLAYEPLWAIGSNKTATPDQAQEVHQFCREVVRQEWGVKTAERLIIQYGGSVKAENAAALIREPDIDGLLVGGASLTLETFSKILQCEKQDLTDSQI